MPVNVLNPTQASYYPQTQARLQQARQAPMVNPAAPPLPTSNLNPETIAQSDLGHYTAAVSQDLYSHLTPEQHDSYAPRDPAPSTVDHGGGVSTTYTPSGGSAHMRLVKNDGTVAEAWGDNTEGITRANFNQAVQTSLNAGQGDALAQRLLPSAPASPSPAAPTAEGSPLLPDVQGGYDAKRKVVATTQQARANRMTPGDFEKSRELLPDDPRVASAKINATSRQSVATTSAQARTTAAQTAAQARITAATTAASKPPAPAKPVDPSVTGLNTARTNLVQQQTANAAAATQPGGKQYKDPNAAAKPLPPGVLLAIEQHVASLPEDQREAERQRLIGRLSPAKAPPSNGPTADPANSGARPVTAPTPVPAPAAAAQAATAPAAHYASDGKGNRIVFNAQTNKWEPVQ